MNIRRAILTDADSRTSYYVAESLHKGGLEIIGLNHNGKNFKSSIYQKIIPITDFEQDPQTFKEVVNSFADGSSIVIPISLKAIRFLERNPNILSDKLYLPKLNGDSFFLVKDKARCIEYMSSLGIPIPKTYFPDSIETAMDIAGQLDFPLVIKIRRETLISPEKRYAIVSDMHQFKIEYERLSNTQENPIVQEFIHGSGAGVSFLSDNGEIFAIFSHKRLREDFITGGPSTYCEGFDSPQLEDYAFRFARGIKWNGIAMMEFKYCQETKEYSFMEVNPRFWGSLELPIRSGVDFPLLYYKWITGELANDKEIIRSRKHLKMKYFERDINSFLKSLSRDGSFPDRLKSIKAFLKEFREPDLVIESTLFKYGTLEQKAEFIMESLSSLIKSVF